jgi:hypothetical protein
MSNLEIPTELEEEIKVELDKIRQLEEGTDASSVESFDFDALNKAFEQLEKLVAQQDGLKELIT